MKRKGLFIDLGMMVLLLWPASVYVSAQTPAPSRIPEPPPPVAKQTPAEKTELSDAELEARIIKTLSKPQAWKQHDFPTFDFVFDLPRDPVRQTESFYDEALGNVKMEMQVAVGDDGTYLVGTMPMPYAITEEKLLREAYQSTIKEFASDPQLKFDTPKDFYFNGRLGMELISTPSDPRHVPAKLRIFIIGRRIYLMIATPTAPDPTPPSKEERDRITDEFERFFASAKVKAGTASQTAAPEDPVFKGTFSNQLYRSEHFGFTIAIPDGWLRVNAEDVESLRQWGRDYLVANSSRSLPQLKRRQNLASFVSKPLGSEKLAMLAINLGLPADKPDAPMQMAKLTQELVSKVQTYTPVTPPTIMKLGTIPAVRMEGKHKFTEYDQNQVIYFIERKRSVLVLTLNYFDESDRKKMDAALATLKFEGP